MIAIREFFESTRHIMAVSYKPGMDTFKRTLKIVLVGILILGILGFVISQIVAFIT
ncbi:MAG: protein translocase SEC61 complex subunit gamma [Candidatus Micrarchaeota archaeon]|nr:protein translocase SEC61 complex subunit gamma [Candidatus Micrarchaeota archaeon]